MVPLNACDRWFTSFEHHAGGTFELICKTEVKRTEQLRARSSVVRHNSMFVDEGRKLRSILAIKMKGANHSGGGKRRAYPVTLDLSYN